MAEDPYVAAVAAELGALAPGVALSPNDTRAALADLRDVLTELGPETDPTAVLGPAPEYAAQLAAAFASAGSRAPRTSGVRGGSSGPGPSGDWDPVPLGPQTTLLGVPADSRGLTEARVRARVWDPANPALLVPKSFGIGWDVNLGAVAVRLGLIRPDDLDDDVLAHIPVRHWAATRWAPLALAGASAAYLALNWRRLPPRVALGWSWDGRPNRWGPRAAGLVGPTLAAGLGAWASRAPQGSQDALVRGAAAAGAAVLGAATTFATVRDSTSTPGSSTAGRFSVAGTALAPVASLAAIALPIRAGLRQVWRRQGLDRKPRP